MAPCIDIHHRDIYTAVEMALKGKMDDLIVNISDDAATSIYHLLKLVGTKMDSSSAPLENPWHFHIDNSLAWEQVFDQLSKQLVK